MRVAVVAEYYPRPSHPGHGIWAHRQAEAVRELGVDASVLVLERPLPPIAALEAAIPAGRRPTLAPMREWASGVRAQPRDTILDGVPVRYVRFVSPPRPLSYASWGRWAARPLARALGELHGKRPLDLVHAHYAVPAGDAVLRWMRRDSRLPLVVSVHGGDLSYTSRTDRGRRVVSSVLEAADAVIANSELTRQGIEQLIGPGERLVVVHPGAEVTKPVADAHADPTLVTVAHLEPHKAQGDVIRALATLAPRHPRLRYTMIGRGPDRDPLEALASSLGVAGRVRFTGGLPHEDALAELGRCHIHVMPSTHDAFGVAHIEAMGAGVPTIAGLGTGAEDIARAGDGAVLVRPGDLGGLVRAIDELLSDPDHRRRLGEAAQKTVFEHFSWQRSGSETAAVYRALTQR